METAPASAGLLPRRLVVADIGCRWGVPERWAAGDELSVYAFDADAEECARLQAVAPSHVTYVPTALSDRAGSARLHLTEEPACSSLFPPDPDALALFPELHVASPVGVRDITVQTLDEWAEVAGVDAVDVMKLDVQGAELAVLRGAARMLPTVRFIEAEVTFNPIYTGQPLFGEVDAFLRERGFLLWRLAHLVHYATEQHDDGVTRDDRQFFDGRLVEFPVGGGQLTWAHAFFCAKEIVHGGRADRAAALLDARAAELLDFSELAALALSRTRALKSPAAPPAE